MSRALPGFPIRALCVVLCCLPALPVVHAQAVTTMQAVTVVGTAEEELKTSLGVSVITATQLEQSPPATDLSEILRREPGVNLTGSAASGMRGNRRQLDIRGMGPDNTLVLIDGQPATSRQASRQGWTGERDTDGDTGWVPPEAIERVEILRGPAAARYGSGAMGGVVNIITKKPTDKLSGSVTYYHNIQQDGDEGDTWRTTFLLSGPLGERLGMRLYGGMSRTEPDAMNINRGHAYEQNGIVAASGKTGQRNRHIDGLFTLDLTPSQSLALDIGYSRKSDLYSGDTQNLNNFESGAPNNTAFIPVTELHGAETTIVQRTQAGLTHRGKWSWGNTRIGLAYSETRNDRGTEGLFGGPEGAFLSDAATGTQPSRYTSTLKTWRLDGEANIPLYTGGIDQMLTIGGEVTRESLDDPGSTRLLQLSGRSFEPTSLPGRTGSTRTAYTSYAVYVEDNIVVNDALTVTPTLRLNHHERFGFNVSPGLTASYALSEAWTIKGGIARAWKTPNLYQSNPNYLLYSRGIGCRTTLSNRGCYLQGNADLKSETSLNKEIGLAYDAGGVRASLAYFHNDYRNKIIAGVDSYGTPAGAGGINPHLLRWENTPRAEVSGLEGHVHVPLSDQLSWTTNATYMISSKDKTYNQPLSIIPKFTVNSTLDWTPTERLSLQANVTWYGAQKPASFDIRRGVAITDAPSLSPYALVGINAGYRISEHFHVRAGINNLFNKQLYRTGLNSGTSSAAVLGAGARTYNEHGRSFFVNVTARF